MTETTYTPTSEDPTEWTEEQVLDMINVVEAAMEGFVGDVPDEHIIEAKAMNLLDKDKNLTRAGKLLFLGWAAARQVNEVEKGFLFMEINELNAKLKTKGS